MAQPNFKSLEGRLQDALDKGNLEMAREIVAAMNAINENQKQSKKKPAKKKAVKTAKKKPAKVVKKKAVKKKAAKPKRQDIVLATEKDVEKLERPAKPTSKIIDFTKAGGNIDAEDDDEDEEDEEEIGGSVTGTTKVKGSPGRIESVVGRKRVNLFHDDGTLASEDRPSNNPQLAKMYSKANANRPTRQPRENQKAKVKCGCGKIDIIPLTLVPNFNSGEIYKCNDCVVNEADRD